MNENLFISPCIGVCTIDQNTQQCIGCGRTLEEISKWTQLSHIEKNGSDEKIGLWEKKKKENFENSRKRNVGGLEKCASIGRSKTQLVWILNGLCILKG